jgi:hypothetical protein
MKTKRNRLSNMLRGLKLFVIRRNRAAAAREWARRDWLEY